MGHRGAGLGWFRGASLATSLLAGCFCVGDVECVEGPGATFQARSGTAESMLVCFNGVCSAEVSIDEEPPIGETGMYVTAHDRGGALRVSVLDRYAMYAGDPTVVEDGDVVRVRLLRDGVVVYDEEHRVDYGGSSASCDCLTATVEIGPI